MNFTDLEQWREALSTAWSNPPVAITGLTVVAIVAFLIGRRSLSGIRAALKAEVESFRRRNASSTLRLALATERQRRMAEQLQEAEIEFTNLKFHISDLGAEIPAEKAEALQAAVSSLSADLRAAYATNEEVQKALSTE